MRAIVVAAAIVVLIVATIRTEPTEPTSVLPSWVPPELGSFEIRAGFGADLAVGPDVAIDVVRRAVFLGDAPGPEPEAVPALVSGRIARHPISASQSGQVVVPFERDAPAWLVAWRGLPGDTLERFGAWPEGALVDAVFLVDGATGDCCWVTRFLAGDSRLG